MASRKEELRVDLTATDQASKVIKGVSDEAKKLDQQSVEVELTAEDKATADVQQLRQRLAALDGDEYTAVLTAEVKKAEAEIKRANQLLAKYDGEEAEAILSARDLAKARVDALQRELSDFEKTYDATLEATDNASGDIRRVQDLGEDYDNDTYNATVDATTGSGLASVLDSIDGIPGSISSIGPIVGRLTGPGAALGVGGLLVGGLAAAASKAGEIASEASQIATFTGSSVEEASALQAVMRDTEAIEANDLLDVIAQMQGVLEDNPNLVHQLGIEMDQVRQDPLGAFVAAVDLLNSGQLSANERIIIGSRLFGEEGVRQVNKLAAALGPNQTLRQAIDAVSDSRILSDEDVENARELKQQMAEVRARFEGIALEVGQKTIPAIEGLIDLASRIPVPDLPGGIGLGDFLEGGAGALETFVAGLAESEDAALELESALRANQITGEEWDAMLADGVITLDEVTEATKAPARPLDVLTGLFGTNTEVVEENTEATEDQVAAMEEEIEALETEIDLYDAAIESLTDLVDAKRDATDTAYAYEDSLDAVEDAVSEFNRVSSDSEATARDQEEALEDVRDAVIESADAFVEQRRAQLAAKGETLSLTDAIDSENHSLLTQAHHLDGPLKTAVLNHVLRLNEVPEEVRSEVIALVNQGKIGEAEALLASVSRRRAAAVDVGVNEAKRQHANVQLNNVARRRDSVIAPQVINYTSVDQALNDLARTRGVEILVNHPRNLASGIPSASAGSFIVGEQGPELVTLPTGARVDSAAKTRDQLGGNGSTTNYYITINPPPGSRPADIANAIRQYERRNGTGT